MGLALGLGVLFLALDIFFAILRAALVNVRVPQMVDLGVNEQDRVERTIQLLEKPRLRAALRVLIGLSHLLVAAAVLTIVENTMLTLTLAAKSGLFAIVLLVLLGLEFLFERIPLANPEQWALKLTPIARVLDWIISPISGTLVRMQGTDTSSPKQLGSVSEDELKTWVEVGQPEGGLEEDERRMIYSIFQFGDTLCREIMVPRIDVLALEVNTPLDQAINSFIESGHSRVPVYDDSIDNVIGLLYAKDLLRLQVDPDNKKSIRKFLRPAYFVPESKKVDDLLAEMQAKGVHIAVVVDEYGGMAGLVTLEDIVEEIVGEIRDEYDQKEELLVQKVSDEEFLFKARVSLDDFNDALGTEVRSDQTDTLGGILYGEMGRVPMEGDSMRIANWELIVEEVRGRRIGKIRALKINLKELEEAEDAPEI